MSVSILTEDERWPLLPLIDDFFKATLQAVSFCPQAEVTLVLADNVMIRDLNKRYRNKDTPTNVLSFPLYEKDDLTTLWNDEKKDVNLGDILLALETIQSEAHIFDHHVYHLFTHGLLHLLGYDHINDQDAAIMENIEVCVLDIFSIPNPYLT